MRISGSVQLHEESWPILLEKCGLARRMHDIMASVRLTGDAGQQADIKKALDITTRLRDWRPDRCAAPSQRGTSLRSILYRHPP